MLMSTQVIVTGLVKRFRFEDTHAEVTLRISSSLLPWVVGEDDEGPQLPVKVSVL